MLAVFAAVLWLSVDQIYQKEASKQHGLTVARIQNAEVIVKSLFADFSQDLKFVAKLKPFSLMAGNWQVSPVYLEQAGGILRSLLASHSAYKAAMVLGQHNRIIIRITKEHASESSEESIPFLYRDSAGRSRFEKNIARILTGDLAGVPVADATHLGEGVGEIVLSVSLAGSLPGRELTLQLVVDTLAFSQLLPYNVFLQTKDSGLVEKTDSGVLRKFRDKVNLNGTSGWIELNSETTFHYRRIDIPPDQELFVGVRHFHPQLKKTLYWLYGGSLGLLAVFLGLIFYLGYFNLSQYMNKLRAQRAMLFSLAALAEERDPETGAHLERTRQYALALAKRLATKPKFRSVITPEYLEDLYDSAPLHDIGKVAIPDSILLKPGKLTSEEFEIMKSHVVFSRKVLEDAALRYDLKDKMITIGINIAAYHHERYDGSGYPNGLKGEDIPLEARIFSLCDAYDVIRSDRPYKKGFSHEEAVARIKADREKHFDPEIVDAFLEREQEFLGISKILSEEA